MTNLDNGHSVDCIANRVYTDGSDGLVLHTEPVRPDRRPHRRADPGRDHLVTHSRPAIRELLESNHLAPRRDLGQNFVADPNTVRRIADLAGVGPGDRVVEIGAGLGSLTLALADTGADDHRRRGRPRDRAAPSRRRRRPRQRDRRRSRRDGGRLERAARPRRRPGWVLVANLPYNVATPLVCDLLDGVPQIRRMLVMVQREAADRFVAAPAHAGLRRGEREGRVLGDGARRRARAGVGVRAAAQRRVVAGARSTGGLRPTTDPAIAVPARARRVRPASQDAAPVARRRRHARAVRGGRRRSDGAARGARRRRVVPAGRRRRGDHRRPRREYVAAPPS